MNKKKWIVTLIISIIFIVLGIITMNKYNDISWLYMGFGAVGILIAAIMIKIVIPDWLNK